MKFHWYYSLPWFDILMHFLGGIWLGATVFYFSPGTSFIKTLGIVLAFGILWEIFELFPHQYLERDPFNFSDSSSDIFFALLGGLFIFYFVKIKNEGNR